VKRSRDHTHFSVDRTIFFVASYVRRGGAETCSVKVAKTKREGWLTPSNPLLRVSKGQVVIDAVASGDVHALRADLEALGMQGAVAFGRIVSGWVPISAIEGMAALASLQFARSASATTHVGLVTSQGDQAMRSSVARAAFDVDGTGVTVGVLSDSFNCLSGAAADVASEDLSPVTVIQELPNCGGATDEGRAMLQLIHDVAPGAGLAFATAFIGQASFASNILALQAAGAGVIVDDVSFFREPMFQDGIIAQAVDTVKRMGVPYFSSAGNSDRQSYESSFRAGSVFADGNFPSAAGAPHFFGGTAHNFDPGPGEDVFQRITVHAGTSGGVDTLHDTGVIRFENRTDGPVSIDSGLQVTTEYGVFQLWDSFLPITLAPGQNLVLAETANFNFDTSDSGLGSNPVVSGSVNGRAFAFTDTARVLLGREEAGAHNVNETTPYQILGRIDGQVSALTARASK
jgi:hypothetical protein